MVEAMKIRALLVLATLGISLAAAGGDAEACIVASEANTLVGWSADGKYALYTLVTDGKIEHAEILPTSYSGYVYTITVPDDGRIQVSRAKVGSCAEWGHSEDPKTIVEKKKAKLTDKTLMELKTVAAMKFGKVEEPAAAKSVPAAPTTAVFTGKKRYQVHNIELTTGPSKLELPLPVFCMGSCLADENWKKWSIIVDGVHTLSTGETLYELRLENVCNGGTLHRVITQTPATTKVPKKRCYGSGG